MTTVFSETWTGSNGAAWNSTRWPTIEYNGGDGSTSIQGNQGRVVGPGGSGSAWSETTCTVQNVVPDDFELLVDIEIQNVTDWHYPIIHYRGSGGDSFRFSVSVTGAFSEPVVERIDDYTATTVASGTQFTLATNDVMHVRIKATGSAHKVRWWLNGASEPTSWNYEFTDANYSTQNGMWIGVLTSSDEVGVAVDFDSMTVTDNTVVASPSTISRSFTVLQPGVGANQPATPSTISAVATLPAATASVGGSAVTSPATIAAAASMPAVAASGGGETQRSPATIPTTTTAPSVTVTAGSTATPSTISRSITTPAVTATAWNPYVFSETWTGSNGSAWNSTRWPTIEGTATIQGNQGRITGPSQAWETSLATAQNLIPDDFEAVLDIEIQTVATWHFPVIHYRGLGGDFYRINISVTSGPGSGEVQVERFDDGQPAATKAEGTYLTLTAGSVIHVRLRATGNTHYLKVWLDGAAEPSAWTYQFTDALYKTQNEFGIGVLTSDTGTGIAVDYDNLAVNNLAAQVVATASISRSFTIPAVTAQQTSRAVPATMTATVTTPAVAVDGSFTSTATPATVAVEAFPIVRDDAQFTFTFTGIDGNALPSEFTSAWGGGTVALGSNRALFTTPAWIDEAPDWDGRAATQLAHPRLSADIDVAFDLTFPGGYATANFSVTYRDGGSGNHFAFLFSGAGSNMALFRSDAYTWTSIASTNPGWTISELDIIHVRLQAVRDRHRVKVWRNAEPEPAWTLTARDGAYMENAGVMAFTAANWGTTSETVTLDNLVISNASTSGVVPVVSAEGQRRPATLLVRVTAMPTPALTGTVDVAPSSITALIRIPLFVVAVANPPVPEPPPFVPFDPKQGVWDVAIRVGSAMAYIAQWEQMELKQVLNQPDTATVALDGDDPILGLIVELVTDLVVLRDGVVMFRGRVATLGDRMEGDTYAVTVTAVDYRQLFQTRMIHTDVTFNNVPQAEIVWQLINTSQMQESGFLGIGPGILDSGGVSRDRSYFAGDYIGKLIDDMRQVIDGFDWWIDTDLLLQVRSPRREAATNYVLLWGSNLKAFDRQSSLADFRNVIRQAGAEGTTPFTATALPDPRGRWELSVGNPNVVLDETLQEKAEGELANRKDPRAWVTCVLEPGIYGNSITTNLGDIVRVVVQRGRLNINSDFRVHEQSFAVTKDGQETVSLALREEAAAA